MSFTLEKFTTVTLRSLNVRAEMHGKDPVPAVDIGFTLTGSNDLLDLFDPGLKAALYRAERDDDEDTEDELPGIEPVSDLRVLRSPSLSMPLKLNCEYLGRNLVIDYGLGGKSNLELHGDLNEFRLDAKQGGSSEIQFRFQASGPTDKAIGKLGSLIKHDVKITVMSSAQADGTQEKLPGTSPTQVGAPATGSEQTPPLTNDKGPSATDIFTATHSKPAERGGEAWPFPNGGKKATEAPPQSATTEKPARKAPAKKTPAKKVAKAKKTK